MSTSTAEEIVENIRRDRYSVGVVQTQYATLFEPPQELTLVGARRL
jgi:hypothetical protein